MVVVVFSVLGIFHDCSPMARVPPRRTFWRENQEVPEAPADQHKRYEKSLIRPPLTIAELGTYYRSRRIGGGSAKPSPMISSELGSRCSSRNVRFDLYIAINK